MTMREEFEEWHKREFFAIPEGREFAVFNSENNSYASIPIQISWFAWQSAYIAGQKAMREMAHNVSERVSMAGSNAAYLIMKEIRALPIEGE